MKLRSLKEKDAPLMLEWMHDPFVVKDMQANFAAKTINDCQSFIKASEDNTSNLNLAIVNDNDEYMGTVSLKNINNGTAEFAITIRRIAMGQGYSKYGMTEIIRIGLEEMKLEGIYWCVNPINERAVRFYDKNGYQRVNVSEMSISQNYSKEQIDAFLWYQVK